ncbi:MAG: hypothetical protein HGA45_19595 [Chloroflexales bacterium]|nr:hypothetical protein [Chloroflexales bacterium]
MAETLGAVLVAEVGSLITRVTLVDQVEGESRMVGHAETSSSVEAPYNNALYGILEAAAAISEMTGRQLLRDGQLIMPQSSERDGVNQVLVATSAAGTMALVITAIAADISARSAVHASRATYTALLQVVTLDDAAGQPAIGPAERSWIERQVETLLSLHPDSVLIAGGLEHGAVDAVNRLAHIVGLTALSSGVDASGQQRQEVTARPVIYAGNSDARERVVEALSDRAEIFVVDNLRPALDRANLDPARQELARLYEKQILPRLPGIGNLRRMSRAPVRTVCEVEGLMTRFLAERTGRRVLAVDVGASASAAFYAAPGRFHPAVLGATGTVYGLTDLLAGSGVADLARWLPFPIDAAILTERLLNRALRPQIMPSSREDIYIEHALAREALRAAYAALRDEAAVDDYDWLVAGGGVLAHAPQLGLALLTLLDALEPTGEHDHPIIDVYLDTLGLLVTGGALAGLDPDAAVTVTDRDLLRNVPLASVVTLLGEGRAGDAAAEVELSVVGGRSQRVSVCHGEIARLDLPQGRFGHLKVRPAGGTRVGTAAPGEVVESDGGDVAGSSLGVVIDARGRPLHLPEDAPQRRARLWRWLVALGVEREQSPYAGAIIEPIVSAPRPVPLEPATSLETSTPPAQEPAAVAGRRASLDELASQEQAISGEVVVSGAAGKRISLDELKDQAAAPPPPPPSPPTPQPAIDSDLDALRQTVEPPKQRGLFGRKK